jgi:ATP-binding cassette subfamily B protein RaxB
LRIAPGEFVAISGTSGCGKSTLIKIVAGLYKPSYGNVYIDDQPLSRWNAQSLRSQIALVALDDSLLQGDDIERMPMGYECLVVDMSTLKLC